LLAFFVFAGFVEVFGVDIFGIDPDDEESRFDNPWYYIVGGVIFLSLFCIYCPAMICVVWDDMKKESLMECKV
jgi:hypothetical protein